MPGRTLAIGDIHGCNVALDTLLDHLQPAAEDTLIVLGDVVDRGPGTRQVIDRLLELRERCMLHFILGNHEEMMLEAYRTGQWMYDWLRFGGTETLASYGEGFDDVPAEHIEFLAAGLDYWQRESEIFVHANLAPDVPLDHQPAEWLRWEHLTGSEPPHPSGRPIICGHTAQRSGRPLIFTGWVCIDTWVYGEGRLSCLDVDSGQLYQSTQAGELLEPVSVSFFA